MRLSLAKPFDGHSHLRDGAMLRAVLPYTVSEFWAAIVMPNLRPPVLTTAMAKAYRDEINAATPAGKTFTPCMTLYLTDATDPEDLTRGYREGIVTAAKLYPAGGTTNAAQGVRDPLKLDAVFAKMERVGMPLSIHGEVADSSIDVFDREPLFIDRILIPLRRKFPGLKIVLEHLTTRVAVDYLRAEGADGQIAGTITPHHLRISRNDMLGKGGLRPHFFCMPIAKREKDRQALIAAATSGLRMFFLGTDSAPHPRTTKQGEVGSSGCFTHGHALAFCAQVFEDAGALSALESFASRNGPAFYNLPESPAQIELEKTTEDQPPFKPILTQDGAEIVFFRDDAPLRWRLVAPSP